jgi:non-ribosomal peptide synthetase component E (peptide arylation enzyme)
MMTLIDGITNRTAVNSLYKTTLSDLIKAQAEKDSKAIAIVAPGRKPLSYGHLNVLVRKTVDMLNTIGVGRNDRVAIVLPVRRRNKRTPQSFLSRKRI